MMIFSCYKNLSIPAMKSISAKKLILGCAGMTVAMWLCISPAFADDDAATPPPQPVKFFSDEQLNKHRTTIKRIEQYLTSLTTIVADFTQVAPDGTLTSGKFFLQRPGRMRWQYNPPTPILMVSSGKELVYYDIELEQVSHIPLDGTLIGFLAQNPVSFEKHVGVVDLSEHQGVIRITIAQLDKSEYGQLALEFSDNPLVIRNMVITDSTHQVTTVSLNNARFGLPISPELFVFRDPRQPRHGH